MVQAFVQNGQIQIQGPIPEAWEGHYVKIVPLTPDDPLPDLEERLEALRRLGPAEFDPGEREHIDAELKRLNEVSKASLQHRIEGASP